MAIIKVKWDDIRGSHEDSFDGLASFCSEHKDAIGVEIPKGVSQIPDMAFYGFGQLERVDIPGSVERIGRRAFADCPMLESVEIGYGVREIGDSAFERCGVLSDVSIPGSVSSVGICAFRHDGSLSDPELPDRCDVQPGAFDFTKGKSREVRCTTYDGEEYGVDIQQLGPDATAAPSGRPIGGLLRKVSLPEGMTYLGEEAVTDMKSLRELELPSGMRMAELGAVERCPSLREVTFDRDDPPYIPLTVKDVSDKPAYPKYMWRDEYVGKHTSDTPYVFGSEHLDKGVREAVAMSFARDYKDPEDLAGVIANSRVSGDMVGAYGMIEVSDAVRGARTREDYALLHDALEGAADMLANDFDPDEWNTRAKSGKEILDDGVRELSRLRDEVDTKAAVLDLGLEPVSSRDMAVLYQRGNTSMGDSRDKAVIPDPADWKADMARRLRAGSAAYIGSGDIEPHAAGAAAAKASPYAGTLSGAYAVDQRRVREGGDVTHERFRQDMRIIRDELLAEQSGTPARATLLVERSDGTKSEPVEFRTYGAAALYMRECVSSRTDTSLNSLSIQSDDALVKAGLSKVYEDALKNDFSREREHAEMASKHVGLKPVSESDWYSSIGIPDGSEEFRIRDAESQAVIAGDKPIATVAFEMPDGTRSSKKEFRTRDGLMGYLSDTVSPLVGDSTLKVQLADRRDYDLAYDVYSAVKSAQGLDPASKDAYIANYAVSLDKAGVPDKASKPERIRGDAQASGGRRTPDISGVSSPDGPEDTRQFPRG